MSAIVIDSDVASAIFKERVPSNLTRHLRRQTSAVTFVTVGELTQWAFLHREGGAHRAALDGFIASQLVLPYSPRVAEIWGEIRARARLRGRPRPVNDSWIAASCIARRLPLATLNTKDFVDYSEHEGLELVG